MRLLLPVHLWNLPTKQTLTSNYSAHTNRKIKHKKIATRFELDWSTCFLSLVSVQLLSHVQLFETHGLQHSPVQHQLLELAQTRVHQVSDAIQPSHPLLLLLPSGSFPMSQFFTSGGHSIGASASVSVLPMNIQDWFLLGLTGLISLQSATLLKYFQYFSGHLHPEVCIPKKNTNPWLFGTIIHPPNPFTCLPMQMQVWSLHQKDSPGGWHGNPLQYSCLENPMDRGTGWVTVHGVAKSWIHWNDLACTHAHVLIWGCGDGKQPLP